MAVVYGCVRFHQYATFLGLLIVKETFRQNDSQSIAFSFSAFEVRVYSIICARPGKYLQIPDTFSREPNSEEINTKYFDSNLFVFVVIIELTLSVFQQQNYQQVVQNLVFSIRINSQRECCSQLLDLSTVLKSKY